MLCPWSSCFSRTAGRALEYEAKLRQLYAQDSSNEALQDPSLNILTLFADNGHQIRVRARDLAAETAEEKDRNIMMLPEDQRKPMDRSPSSNLSRNLGTI